MSGGNGKTNVSGVGELTFQRAIDIARNTEGTLDPAVNAYLEHAITSIWQRICLEPNTYILTQDEFAVFNYFILRFEGQPMAQMAVERYWKHTGHPPPS